MVDSDGTERSQTEFTALEQSVLTLDDVDGKFDVTTDDFALDREIWNLKIYYSPLVSTVENRNNHQTFAIEFKNVCWDADLVAATWFRDELRYELYEQQSFIMSPMENLNQGKNCGGYHYVPEFVDYETTIDFFDYYSTTPVGTFLAIQGILTDRWWTE
jgi:hypothetical protein